MEVTEVRIKLNDKEGKTKAFASIVLDNSFMIKFLKIIKGSKGHYVAMPYKKMSDGKIKDIAFPINNKIRIKIENAVLDAYEEKLNE